MRHALGQQGDSLDPEQWAVYGIPVFLSDQVEPGDMVAFSKIYEPTDEQPNRWRISAAKIEGVGL